MAEIRRKARRKSTPLRVTRPPARPQHVRRHPVRSSPRPTITTTVTRPSVKGHQVKRIVQFKSKTTGKYFVAVYTINPVTKREERVIVNPRTLSPQQLQQLRDWHEHHKNKGKWIHAIATDPNTWATIGKILLAA